MKTNPALIPTSAACCLALALAGSAGTAAADDYGMADKRAPEAKDHIAPAFGAEKVSVVEPSWCTETPKKLEGKFRQHALVYLSDMGKDFDKELKTPQGSPSLKTLSAIAASACIRPKDKVRQQWIAIARQKVLNHTGLTDKALTFMFAALLDPKLKGGARQSCMEAQQLRLPSTASVALQALMGCPGWERGDRSRWLTMMSQPRLTSQIERGGMIAAEFELGRFNLTLTGKYLLNGSAVSPFVATYSNDFPGYEVEKVWKELKAAGASRAMQVFALKAAAYARYVVLWREKAYRDLIATHPDGKEIEEVVFKVPPRAVKAYLAKYNASKKNADAAFAIQAAVLGNGRRRSDLARALKGCSKTLRGAFASYLRSNKPKSLSDVRDIAGGALGYPITAALALCEGADGDLNVTAGLHHTILKRYTPVTGVRDVAKLAAAGHIGKLHKDISNFSMGNLGAYTKSPLGDSRPWYQAGLDMLGIDYVYPSAGDWTDREPTDAKRGADAQIAAMKKMGDYVALKFKTMKWKEPVYRCKPTNRIRRIWPDGRVEYKQDCVQVGTKMVKATMPPIRIHKAYAAGLKKKSMVRLFFPSPYRGEGIPAGLVLEAYKSSKKKKLTAVLGVPLK